MTEIAELAGTSIDLTSAPLAEVEGWIAPRLRAFVEAGCALLAIRERKLYLTAGFDRWDAYCRDRWGIDDTYARRLCDAAQVAQITASTGTPNGATVENEAQARELAPLLGQPDQLRAVWLEAAERTGGSPTAAAIRNVRKAQERRSQPAPQPPAPPRPTPEPPARPAPAIPAEAQRLFALITQACEEGRSAGGAQLIRDLHARIGSGPLAAWRQGFTAAAAFCSDLARACQGEG